MTLQPGRAGHEGARRKIHGVPAGTSGSLRIALRPSTRLAIFTGAAHGGAVLCMLALELPGPLRALIALGVLWSLAHTLCRHALLRDREAVTEIERAGAPTWNLVTRGGRRIRSRLEPVSYVHPLLLVLRFRCDGERWLRSVVVLPDMAAADALRRLRVHLHQVRDDAPDPDASPDASGAGRRAMARVGRLIGARAGSGTPGAKGGR